MSGATNRANTQQIKRLKEVDFNVRTSPGCLANTF
jgi:hypothetical protein